MAALAEKTLQTPMQESSPPDVRSALPGRDEVHGPAIGDLCKPAVKVEQTLGGVNHLGRPQVHLRRL